MSPEAKLRLIRIIMEYNDFAYDYPVTYSLIKCVLDEDFEMLTQYFPTWAEEMKRAE